MIVTMIHKDEECARKKRKQMLTNGRHQGKES